MKAKLVQDKTRNGFRTICQHEKSNNTFYPSYPNHAEYVDVIEATQENIRPHLKKILEELGLKNVVVEDTDKLVDKFYKELCTSALIDKSIIGSLAYNETSTKEKLFLIIGEEIKP